MSALAGPPTPRTPPPPGPCPGTLAPQACRPRTPPRITPRPSSRSAAPTRDRSASRPSAPSPSSTWVRPPRLPATPLARGAEAGLYVGVSPNGTPGAASAGTPLAGTTPGDRHGGAERRRRRPGAADGEQRPEHGRRHGGAGRSNGPLQARPAHSDGDRRQPQSQLPGHRRWQGHCRLRRRLRRPATARRAPRRPKGPRRERPPRRRRRPSAPHWSRCQNQSTTLATSGDAQAQGLKAQNAVNTNADVGVRVGGENHGVINVVDRERRPASSTPAQAVAQTRQQQRHRRARPPPRSAPQPGRPAAPAEARPPRRTRPAATPARPALRSPTTSPCRRRLP